MPDRVDWFRLLWDIRIHQGLNLAAVARKVGVSKSQIKSIWTGHEPRHWVGEKLLALAAGNNGRAQKNKS